MATFEKSRDGQYIRAGWWCAGRVHHHRTQSAAELCEEREAKPKNCIERAFYAGMFKERTGRRFQVHRYGSSGDGTCQRCGALAPYKGIRR